MDTGDDLCEVCGCWATRYFGLTPLCDNRVCEQVLIDEMEPDNNNEGAQE